MNSQTKFRSISIKIVFLTVCAMFIWSLWLDQAHACLFSCNIANDLNTLDQSGAQEQNTTVFSSGNFNVNYCSSGDCNTSFYSNGDGTYSTITTNNNSSGSSNNGGNNTPKPKPTVTLKVKNATRYPSNGQGWTVNELSIGQNDAIHLTWASSNVTKCTGTSFDTDGKKSGTQKTVTEPDMGESITYKVTCTGSYGTAVDSIKVTTLRPPVTSLFVKNATINTAEIDGDTSIAVGDKIHLRWAATRNPSKCVASASPADASFNTGDDVAGTDKTVAEPASGASRTYSVTCSNRSGSHTDSLVVTTGIAPVVTLYIQNVTENSAETTNDVTIGSSDTVQLRYAATNNPTTCTPSASPSDSTFGTNPDTTVTEPAAGASRTYSVTCSNRSGSHTDSIVVTTMRAPVVTLYVKNTTTNTAETTNDVTIAGTDQIQLRYAATNNPTTCTPSASPADSTFGTNPDTTVTEPAAGASRTYSVTCSNRSGSHTDSLTVTVPPPPPRSCLLDGVTMLSGTNRTFYQSTEVPYRSVCTGISRTCTDGTLSGDSSYRYASCVADTTPDTSIFIRALPQVVRYEGETSLEWDGKDADSCSVAGGQFTSSQIEGQSDIEGLQSQVTFTLSCLFGANTIKASTTVKVLPRMQET